MEGGWREEWANEWKINNQYTQLSEGPPQSRRKLLDVDVFEVLGIIVGLGIGTFDITLGAWGLKAKCSELIPAFW
eukprot:CAMPEP_0184482568 /NCGR_PEP_ID=MMETSP0113_2-20130426/4131_1 /TAXON_ID=91329 /ORGANISM="Norrisiella sphaerica, Strain BC52" /LENGTH=74 /DNA_ID=CAMNT_0026862383 /DNA_START=431 /DNA_END=652 /DNA_ORIENTATION=+